LGCKWSQVQILSPRPSEGPGATRDFRDSGAFAFGVPRKPRHRRAKSLDRTRLVAAGHRRVRSTEGQPVHRLAQILDIEVPVGTERDRRVGVAQQLDRLGRHAADAMPILSDILSEGIWPSAREMQAEE